MNDTNNVTVDRKQSHVAICLHGEVGFDAKTTGFERYAFTHNAVPELDFDGIDLSTELFGRRLSFPFMISSMTGGYGDAERVNRVLAETAEKLGIPLGVGSMRQALESSSHRKSFSVVREAAPSVPVFANIGAPEVAGGLTDSELRTLVDIVKADALVVHFNPAQELFQPEGNTGFSNVLAELRKLVKKLDVPVIAKEVGCGISSSAARALAETGIRIIDVAGAGGTSWQKVEEERYIQRFRGDSRFSPAALHELLNWGIPTAECVADIATLKKEAPQYRQLRIIASGGISNGVDIAKAIALGAEMAASAGVLLKALDKGVLEETILSWMNDLKAVMFLTGAKNIAELKQIPISLKKDIAPQ
ncbi:type 2 isopentenyl-diphosphate Delta-isomerase [Prosthecochloris sp. GSB1]|uniref:type 2 isopentenyl-diphosphate Delta-isomerase n=1 Tax=Prosthecochloris sp. GSB1 TaxID=281093 RepID=UPI000B8D0A03|nr:type 2 isopentenyl-diphosphate Delta-isomerase [Prosthecochloris sp. GSB1]ASQ91577.1 type 2 isopentenyl-diphosphate Delta-isomerase [Prosthecochloris sp. GSB1]